jgi:YVTN family beta-propeller protein
MKRSGSVRRFWFGLGVFAFLVFSQPALAQWLESTVYLPDSFSGAVYPTTIAHNAADGKIYVGGGVADGWLRGGHDCWIAVLDGAATERVARIAVRAEVTALCYGREGNKLYASHAVNSSITVIDAAADTVAAVVRVPRQPSTLCYNPVANKLYIAHRYDTARIVTAIDCSTNSVAATVNVGPVLRPSVLVCVPELNKVYCFSNLGREVAVIDCTADTVQALLTLQDTPANACYDTAGRRLFIVGGYRATAIDAVADTVIASVRLSCGVIKSICFSPGRNQLYVAAELGDVIVLDASTLITLAIVHACQGRLRAACYNPRDDKVYLMDDAPYWAGDVHIVDCATNRLVASVDAGVEPAALLYDGVEDKVHCVGRGSDDVTVIDGAGDTMESVVAVGCRPRAFCYSPSEDKVYCLSQANGLVSALDGASNRVVANVRVGYDTRSMCYSSVSNKVYCPSFLDGSVHVIDCATDSVVTRVPVDICPEYVCYGERQNRVYVGSNHPDNVTGTMSVIDCTSDSVVNRIGFATDIIALGYGPTTDKLYVGTGWGGDTLKVFDCSADTLVADLPGVRADYVACDSTWNRVYCLGEHLRVVDGTGDTLRAVVTVPGPLLTPWGVSFNEQLGKAYVVMEPWVPVMAVKYDSLLRYVDVVTANGVCCSPVNNKVYLTYPREEDWGLVNVVDCVSDRVIRQIPVGMSPGALLWNPLRNKVYAANSASGSVSVICDSVPQGVADDAHRERRRQVARTILGRSTELVPAERAVLLDVSGRLASRLRPVGDGPLDLSPGVYFLRALGDTQLRKIVVTR